MELKQQIIKFGSDFKNSAEKLTKTAVDSSRKLTEKVKIQNKIHQAEAKLNETYIAMGKKYEELYGNRADPAFSQYLADIADARAQIAAARAEMSAAASAAVCPKCGKYLTQNQKFCPYCGSKKQEDDAVIDISTESEIRLSETPIDE